MSLSTQRVLVKLLVVVISLVGFAGQSAPADVLVTKDGSRFQGKVIEQGDSYLLVKPDGRKMTFPKEKVEEVIKQQIAPDEESQAPKRSKADEVLRPLKLKLISVRKDLNAVIRGAKVRQQRERKAPVDDFKVLVAEKRLELVQEIIAAMREYGMGPGSELTEVKRGGLSGETIETRIIVDEWGKVTAESSVHSRNDHRWRIVRVETGLPAVERSLADAERALKRALGPPDKVLDRHKRELREYDELKRMFSKTQLQLRRARRALEPIAEKPDLLKAEKAKWEKAINESIEKIHDALVKVRRGDSIAEAADAGRKPDQELAAKPTGFYTEALSPTSERSTKGRQNLVVVVSVSSELFIPSNEEYIELQDEYPDLFTYYRRSQVRVFDSGRFKLILKDGWGFRPDRLILRAQQGGGDVVVNSARRCVVHYGEEPPPTTQVRLAWLLDAKDWTLPFKFQLDDFEPVSVPGKQVSVPASRRRSSPRSSRRATRLPSRR